MFLFRRGVDGDLANQRGRIAFGGHEIHQAQPRGLLGCHFDGQVFGAAADEGVEGRAYFLRLGGAKDEILGAYQGNFIFMTQQGIFTAKRLEGMRYLLMVRLNGKLVMPGAVVRREPSAPDQPPGPEQK